MSKPYSVVCDGILCDTAEGTTFEKLKNGAHSIPYNSVPFCKHFAMDYFLL